MNHVQNAPLFVATAFALMNTEKLAYGFTSNGLRRYDFQIGDVSYTAIEQNVDKISTPGQLAKEGNKIVQIRDSKAGNNGLIGFVNLSDKTFNLYTSGGAQVSQDISEVQKVVNMDDFKNVVVKPAGSSTGTGRPVAVEHEPQAPAQNSSDSRRPIIGESEFEDPFAGKTAA